MKRQSKAEEALRAQTRIIQGSIDECDFQVNEIRVRRETLFNLQSQIEFEIARLEKVRKQASESRKS